LNEIKNSNSLTVVFNMLKRFPRLFCLLLLCAACSGPHKMVSAADESSMPVYVISHGWHAGIALRRTDLLPESADFPGADYLEFGWGDWDYYQTRDPGLWRLLQAAFWSSNSVLHVMGIQGSIGESFSGFEIVRLEIPSDRFFDLAAFIHASFQRETAAAKTLPLRRGFGANSIFYPAAGEFHLFNNCNTWVARALESAGYDMGAPLPFTTDQLLARTRRLSSAPP
jgi:uncharacterized protein (TIGR02117 family)